MPKTALTKKGINLLQESTTPKTFWDKFYIWALSIGRFIIVGTEAIVLVVFIMRFKLDRDVNDIADSILVKASILQSYTETEEETLKLQDYLLQVKNVSDTQVKYAEDYKKILEIKTNDVEVTNIQIAGNTLDLTVTAKDLGAFTVFEEAVKKQTDLLYDITISNAEKVTDDGLDYYALSVNAKIKQPTIENE